MLRTILPIFRRYNHTHCVAYILEKNGNEKDRNDNVEKPETERANTNKNNNQPDHNQQTDKEYNNKSQQEHRIPRKLSEVFKRMNERLD
jgi:hypothetical protein